MSKKRFMQIFILSLTLVFVSIFINKLYASKEINKINYLISEKCSISSESYIDDYINETFISLDSPISVVEYYSPKCIYCKDFYGQIKKIEKEYSDKISISFQPFLLQENEMIYFNALYLANEKNKHHDLMDIIFSDSLNQLNVNQLFKYLGELSINNTQDSLKIRKGFYSDKIYTDRKKIIDSGVMRVPTFTINGYVLNDYSQLKNCLDAIVD